MWQGKHEDGSEDCNFQKALLMHISISSDLIIQLPDMNPHGAYGSRRLIWEYLWSGEETGGQYEGQKVMSVVPGIGMLANGDPQMQNVLPYKPSIDNAGLSRYGSPAAGSITPYHNYSWYAQQDIPACGEILVNYGPDWFRERGFLYQSPPTIHRPLSDLRENGYCLDNLVPGKSKLEQAGRGAFAARQLEEGSLVAPFPVLQLSSSSLVQMKQRESGQVVIQQQLLRNYCFGHTNSSILLYPYAPAVNLINHHSNPNVELRWTEASISMLSKPTGVLQESSSHLLLELVALRPIAKGGEILLHYGVEWEQAWEKHVQAWRPTELDYQSSQDVNDAHPILKTQLELRSDPYPDNVFTSCFYRYNNQTKAKSAEWKATKGIYESRSLRPCLAMDRKQTAEGRTLYTVRILNRHGLPPRQRIPRGQTLVVTHVPREAIVFSDKLYTTDHHLEAAFRKEMALGDIFPKQWIDLGNS